MVLYFLGGMFSDYCSVLDFLFFISCEVVVLAVCFTVVGYGFVLLLVVSGDLRFLVF